MEEYTFEEQSVLIPEKKMACRSSYFINISDYIDNSSNSYGWVYA